MNGLIMMIILVIIMGVLSIGAIAFFIYGLYHIWQKITKPHIKAVMKVEQAILQQPTSQLFNNNSNGFSQRETRLIETYRKLSEQSKQKLDDYADTLNRRDNQ